jgi:tRNA A-37 threonylcarbamoyl transferase component Bud32/tetratricopeptide (TPR) repeat protein
MFADRYMIERELGRGSTAVVYLARDTKHDRDIALKVLSKDLAHALGAERFLREIRVTAKLNHPHILAIYDSGESNGMLYYVVPFVAGESLRERIDREKQLPIEECVRLTSEVAEALTHAHAAGIIHRDVKPENVMLADGHALLSDFGIARAVDTHTGERLTSSGLIVGTSAYMSPEQASGEEKIDARSDIYSLGCVLYEMLAGVQPFSGPSTQAIIAQRFTHKPRPVSTFRPSTPDHIQRALEKALAVAPADRYRNVKDFAAAIAPSSSSAPDQRMSPLRRAIYARRRTFGFAAAAIVLLTAAFVIANPPGPWHSLFASSAALDSTKYVVVPYATGPLGDKDVAAASSLGSALEEWKGVSLADNATLTDAIAQRRDLSLDESLAITKELGAGRLVRVSSSMGATLYDARSGARMRDAAPDTARVAADRYSALALALLAPPDRPAAALGGDGRTHSLDAWLAYNRGHVALVAGDIPLAQREFASAIATDETFTPARLWLAQVRSWPDASDWKQDAKRTAATADQLAPHDRLLAIGLAALAQKDFPNACASYNQLLATDSTDYVALMGLGECQQLDRNVRPSKLSPSGFAFRASPRAAERAFLRAVGANPISYDLIGYSRMASLKPVRANIIRLGTDSTQHKYVAYATLDHDTLAFVPYPAAVFASLPASRFATRRDMADRNQTELVDFASNWVRALPKSADGFEALATALEASGNLTSPGSSTPYTASGAVVRALQLSTFDGQRVRLTTTEIGLRVKRGEFASARMLADSIFKSVEAGRSAPYFDLTGPAALTGRIAMAAQLAGGPGDNRQFPQQIQSVHVPPQVAEAAALFLAHAALGDCSGHSQSAYALFDQRMHSYLSEKERTIALGPLIDRSLSLNSACTRGRSALLISGNSDRLARIQQAFARGDIRNVRLLFDSVSASRVTTRPTDTSPDYTFQEAWLHAAIGDTAAAIQQLDQTLNALPALRGVREIGGAASIPRAMMLRADLAYATHDLPTAKRFARAVADLWANADPELQPTVARMRQMAAASR